MNQTDATRHDGSLHATVEAARRLWHAQQQELAAEAEQWMLDVASQVAGTPVARIEVAVGDAPGNVRYDLLEVVTVHGDHVDVDEVRAALLGDGVGVTPDLEARWDDELAMYGPLGLLLEIHARDAWDTRRWQVTR